MSDELKPCYTQGVCEDGAAILKDGIRMTVDEIVAELNTRPTEQQAQGFGFEATAKRFHEIYERLAPEYGYETRKESAVPWEDVPENNKQLMIAVCKEIQAAQAQ